jgi:hypothetical protein
MTEATTSQPSVTQPNPGLLTRLIGVLFSPRETFAAIVARPKWLGAVTVVGLIMGAATFAQLSTDIGKELALDQQVSAVEAFGVTISDEQYAQMERSMENARYTSPIFTIFAIPLFMTISAGILHLMFGLIGGGNGTYKQVYAISAHTAIISALQLVFTTIVTLAAGRAAGANLSVFTPTLEDTTFVYKFLSYIDVFYVWSTFVTAIGLGVLYKRRTGPIAMVLFGIYFVIAALIAYVASGS